GLQIAARGLELAVGVHDRRQLREPPADLAGTARIRVQIRIGELLLQVGVLGEDGLDAAARLSRGLGARGPCHGALLSAVPATCALNVKRRPACARAADRASVR